MESIAKLVQSLKEGNQRALARLISLVENDDAFYGNLLQKLQLSPKPPYVIGVTGPPGSGKSTLVDELIHLYRKKGEGVGVLAVDPTSPFSGGAILGDRIRMQKHSGDAGVFIRSIGTRGVFGGLARVVRRAIRLMDAFGMSVIFVETVGVGQIELDVMNVADTVVVLLVPESGDAVQTMKAGLMEIADLFVVNKGDRPGAEQLARQIRESTLRTPRSAEKEAVLVTVTQASLGAGIAEVFAALVHERTKRLPEDNERKMRQRRGELVEIVLTRFESALRKILEKQAFQELLQDVQDNKMDPYLAAQKLWKKVMEDINERGDL